MHARVQAPRIDSLAVTHRGLVVYAGAVAQGLAGWLTNPFDLLKTRVQSGVAANVGAAFRSVLLEGGPAALMRGAGMQVLITAPSSPHRSVLLEGGPAALMRGAGMRVFWIAPQVC